MVWCPLKIEHEDSLALDSCGVAVEYMRMQTDRQKHETDEDREPRSHKIEKRQAFLCA